MDEAAAALDRWRQQAIRQATSSGVDATEVDWLLRELAGWTPLDRLMHRPPPRRCAIEQLDELWQQRLLHNIPLQQLLQTVTWRRLQLTVTDAVLIPRPETEQLVDLALDCLAEFSMPGLWVDMGTGSGAISVGMAHESPELSVIAVDTSAEALAVAAHNIERYKLGQQISLLQGNWFDGLRQSSSDSPCLQGMVSNPPYIPSDAVEKLAPEVRDREPRLALDGGADGLVSIRHLIQEAPHFLQSGGCWLVELMYDQAAEVSRLLAEDGRYRRIESHPDLDGNQRFVSARRI
ncbi:MAG: peptide chain release factor N(5)-glutamine methyltransferase [Cyanobacteria bacterium P01_E01_bin.45]